MGSSNQCQYHPMNFMEFVYQQNIHLYDFAQYTHLNALTLTGHHYYPAVETECFKP